MRAGVSIERLRKLDRANVQGHNFVLCQKIPLPSIFPAFKVKANKATHTHGARASGLPFLFRTINDTWPVQRTALCCLPPRLFRELRFSIKLKAIPGRPPLLSAERGPQDTA